MTFRDYLFWHCVIGWVLGALLIVIETIRKGGEWDDPKQYLGMLATMAIVGSAWPVVIPLLIFLWLDEL